MYGVAIESYFSAAHNLRGYQGKCEQLHGHNWKVQVKLVSRRLDKLGMVCDFRELKKKLEKVIKELDHSHLNQLPYFKKNNPTSEKIAEFIYSNLKKLFKGKTIVLKEVLVWETETSCAIFNEENSENV
ncbi:MAG: 6-carboxytetrahydropterin synthase QueD [Omnitrophica bacterium]|nr:6-carboxytetrahydropterin synthase QueD [Candidatus Omnitrophota bacterium]